MLGRYFWVRYKYGNIKVKEIMGFNIHRLLVQGKGKILINYTLAIKNGFYTFRFSKKVRDDSPRHGVYLAQ